ncbi:LysM domain containing protein, putative [Leishmania lindenbergi]|uniref:LysM domain containing protein n=1 Tax=Leishmania lindenbergi TaxID=651832 RepID=A0AAW3ANG0_9TRYP
MEGLRRQVELLCTALESLDVRHDSRCRDHPPSLPEEVVSALQVALARATALADWATAVQREQPLPQRTSDVSDAAGLKFGASAQQQTLLSVAALFKVSVADIRQWNPQLPPTLREGDVLPPDTYLKVRPAPSPVSPPQPSSTSVSRTRLVPGATASLGVTVSGTTSARSTSAKSQVTDAGCGDSVAAPWHNSAFSSSPSGCSKRDAGTGVSSGGVGGRVLPLGSEGGASQGRCSAWAMDSGCGTSRSPQIPEPSMPNSYPNAAPPSCAPAPVLMPMPIHLCSSPDRSDLIDLKEDVMEPSPSPERDAHASGRARRSCTTPKTSSPSPPVSSLAPPPPFSGVVTLSTAAAAAVEATPLHYSGPQGDVIGGGSSGTTAGEISMRGHSRSSSRSPTGEMLVASVGGPKGRISVRGDMASSGVSATISQLRLQSPSADGESDQREPRKRTTGWATAASVVPSPETKGGARVLPSPSPARESSVSLSAVSPPSSLGEGRWSNGASSRARAGSKEGEGERHVTEVQRPPQLSPSQQRRGASASSLSLASPSYTSSCSPMTNGQSPASAATASKAAVTSGDVSRPNDFLTPIQRRGGCGPQCTSGAAFSTSGHLNMHRSPLSAALSSSPEGRSGIETEVVESPRSDTEDYMEDEEESTPCMRPPTMLGCRVSSPPPNLSRFPQTGCTEAGLSTAPPRRAVDPPPRLRQRSGGKRDAGLTAPVAAQAVLLPSLASPSHLEPPPQQQQLPELSELDDAIEEVELAGEDNYDTLEGIAAVYNLTVPIIIEWNPYLKKYRPSEPLPPDLPIVLPMSDEDEEDGEGTDSIMHEVDSRLLLKPHSRLENWSPDGYSPSGTSDNSPAPQSLL